MSDVEYADYVTTVEFKAILGQMMQQINSHKHKVFDSFLFSVHLPVPFL